jgi:hypothetical protein
MKFALFFTALTLSGFTSVFGSPTRPTTLDALLVPGSETAASPISLTSVDGSLEPTSNFTNAAAASAQYWVCVAVSPSTYSYGYSQGGSESSALGKAQANCSMSDCNSWACQELGCVGLNFGSRYYAFGWATGYGYQDGNEAAGMANSSCNAYTSGCGTPGYYCSYYIL